MFRMAFKLPFLIANDSVSNGPHKEELQPINAFKGHDSMSQRTVYLILSLLICMPFSAGARGNRTQAAPLQDISPLVGSWQSSSFGTQTLTKRADGTATLEMRLSPMVAVLYGREITLQLKWSLDGQTLTHHVVSGFPVRGVQKLTKKFGETYTYRILEATPEQLVVEDIATGKTSHWTAVDSKRND